MIPRIAKIVITQPNDTYTLGAMYEVAPTPFYAKGINQNGRFGVWVYCGLNVFFVPFSLFLVVEYRYNPNPAAYGFYSSRLFQNTNAYWGNFHSRIEFLRLRREYRDLE